MEHYFDRFELKKQWVLYSIIAINVILWVLLQFPSKPGAETYTLSDQILFEGAKINSQIQIGEWWRLLTAGFLHKDALHIFSNMYSLYMLWQLGQRFLDHYKIAAIYLVSIVGGSLISFLFSPSYSIGASGGVFGLFGLAVILAIKLKHNSLLTNLGQVLLINVVIGLIGSSYIDNWAHLGGFVTGTVLSLLATLAITRDTSQRYY
jgi:rhomboid protease GluP